MRESTMVKRDTKTEYKSFKNANQGSQLLRI